MFSASSSYLSEGVEIAPEEFAKEFSKEFGSAKS
jgi:hypothetical protein